MTSKAGDALRDAKVFLLLLNPQYFNGPLGPATLQTAIEAQKPIVLVNLRERGLRDPPEFTAYQGPKLVIRNLDDISGGRMRMFMSRHGAYGADPNFEFDYETGIGLIAEP